VRLSAWTDETGLVLEIRTTPRTRVVMGVAAALSPDGKTLALDDPLFIASSVEPRLRGVTNRDGFFRASLPLDPAFRERAGKLFAQAAKQGDTETRVTDPSAIVTVSIEPATRDFTAAIAWALATLAALGLAALLPARLRLAGARLIAVLALVATPVLLIRGFGRSFVSPPFLPYGGDVDAPLDQHLGPDVARGLRELNTVLPPSDAVVFVEFPLATGDDLLLHRLFAKRPYATIPNLGLLGVVKAKGVAQPIVVTVDDVEPPPGAVVVYRANSIVAWRAPG
jgi:hypothetical protein